MRRFCACIPLIISMSCVGFGYMKILVFFVSSSAVGMLSEKVILRMLSTGSEARIFPSLSSSCSWLFSKVNFPIIAMSCALFEPVCGVMTMLVANADTEQCRTMKNISFFIKIMSS